MDKYEFGRYQRFGNRRCGWGRSRVAFGSRPAWSEGHQPQKQQRQQQQQQQQQQNQPREEVVHVEEQESGSGGHYIFPPSAKTLPQPPPEWLMERESDKNPLVDDSWKIFKIHLK
ncbi:unnamed protein product [Rodentolepis nana]|uniref:Btz domain-containing protein n=1 Tax=Rodentolepis nana TaxID=102285 RepID=A0A0R3T9Z8_RODNA|nr:unnamed protein product [Rodentolepis nana]